MQQMAEAMNKAAQGMQQGDAQQAADALQQMSDQLGEMQQEMSELQDLQAGIRLAGQLEPPRLSGMRCSISILASEPQ